jgi:hypothetical protein
LISALPALVPTVFAGSGLCEIRAPQRARTPRTNPADFAPPEHDPIVARHVLGSPIFIHFRRTRPRQFTRWSDLQPVSQLVRTAFYDAGYPPFGARDCCTMLSDDRPKGIEYVAGRLDKQITDRHRDLRVSISPHAQQASRLAHTTSALMEMAATNSGPHRPERALLRSI